MQRYPDIEIYLASADIQALDAWLAERLDASPLTPAGKHQWRTVGHLEGIRIPVLVVEKAADSFASLWLDSNTTPWPRDVDCARDASTALGCEVRCSLGGWQPGDDPDRFWRVLPDGTEEAFTWPDSGH
ncbi:MULTISPECIES: hypothetical protein [Halomonadaceae]|uniref:hypothetical protein n=1 Tax=Halomonadaceae TaxID=28256 RepID=UPI00159AA661|nr:MULTISPECIES: hypothetical protein [Halomonas]QJQ95023.1 hypothetical protein HIO72_06905 [Halomonas sp. PA5]